ncbi:MULTISPECIES: LysR family transcriptional regulator [unclassified Ruegeria]|uniref:LysR family transcriptional regulator n=1 Tax=unclassified Ruegeria TaxID=2625375 RepID=UPI001487C943|nr:MULTISPECIES: LysR family transcriptional regulator [unclassified Ruegeria]
MNEPLDWNGVRDFLATVKVGSLTRAAIHLRISQPTLSRRIAALEEQLGVQLLVRGPRHFKVTEAGIRLQTIAQQMQLASRKIESDAWESRDLLGGTVRVSATEAITNAWLIEQLPGFMETYPEISVEMVTDNRLTDLLNRNSDVAIRLLRPTQKELIAKKVGVLKVGYYASVTYVEKNGAPKSADDLKGHRTIAIEGSRKFASDVDEVTRNGTTALRLRNVLGVMRAIKAGLGIGPVYCFHAERQHDLVRVLEKEPPIEMEIWLTAHPELRENPSIRAVYDFLDQCFAKQKGQFT